MGKTLGVNSGGGVWKHDGGVGGRRWSKATDKTRLVRTSNKSKFTYIDTVLWLLFIYLIPLPREQNYIEGYQVLIVVSCYKDR